MVPVAPALYHGIVLATTAYASLTYQHSPIFERPTQSSIFILAFSGLLYLSYYLLISRGLLSRSTEHLRSTLPLHGGTVGIAGASAILNPWRAIRCLSPLLQRQILTAAFGICLLVEIFRYTLASRQCLASSNKKILGFTPCLLLVYNHLRRQKENALVNTNGSKPSGLAYSMFSLNDIMLISSTLGLGFANDLTKHVLADASSTYICPSSSYVDMFVPWTDIPSFLLLCFVLHTTMNVIESHARLNSSALERPFVEGLGYIFMTASAIMAVGGSMAFLTQPMNWQWTFNFDQSYILSLFWHSFILTSFMLAAVETFIDYGMVHIATLVAFTTTFSIGMSHAAEDRSMLPTPGPLLRSMFVLVLTSSLALYLISGGAGSFERLQRQGLKPPRIIYPIILGLAVALNWSIGSETKVLDSHPLWSFTGGVQSLIGDATIQASEWERQASSSQNLDDAVGEYWRRYRCPPPPGFDAWYKFATVRASLVIDDYDSISEDLRPFWGISPAEIRLRTAQTISDTWNEVSEIRIRDGKADLGPNFKPTHRWMLDGILSMIKDFSLFLPDMDIAFNLNDEPRVAVPYATMQQLEKAGSEAKGHNPGSPVLSRWSPNRDLQWDPLAELQPSRPFTSIPRINSFSAATAACPPNSAARSTCSWDPQPLCITCIAPHSTGPFLNNWTLAASPCHQPDLRNLHGFYLSPAAFKTSTTLVPIFSQSKVAGFADILYPSPWNYIDKAVYAPENSTHPDPPFSEKENTLFWRGGTSEGVSRFGTWKGMARQRLVHLANNPSTATSPLLVHHPNKPGMYIYDTSSPSPRSETHSSTPLSLNISIVGEFARAWDNDGAAQAAEFPLATPVDFQHHWQYRYLFDTDGAGFSGRFLPFLQSRCLPFRAAIFRAWYDARITAWRHFVPIDIRLHGLMASLQYFAGTGRDGGTGLEADVASGERIAEAGREWAGKVLRKEDMEVYLFRLLLEWGRLTDDRRAEIGFALPE